MYSTICTKCPVQTDESQSRMKGGCRNQKECMRASEGLGIYAGIIRSAVKEPVHCMGGGAIWPRCAVTDRLGSSLK